MSNEKDHACLGYTGDYTTQLWGDYNKPSWGSLLNNQYSMESKTFFSWLIFQCLLVGCLNKNLKFHFEPLVNMIQIWRLEHIFWKGWVAWNHHQGKVLCIMKLQDLIQPLILYQDLRVVLMLGFVFQRWSLDFWYHRIHHHLRGKRLLEVFPKIMELEVGHAVFQVHPLKTNVFPLGCPPGPRMQSSPPGWRLTFLGSGIPT